MILWGNTFPKIELREYVIGESIRTGSSLPCTIKLSNEGIIPESEVVKDDNNVYVRGTDYLIDYADGKITVFATGSMRSNRTYYIDYEYVYLAKTIDSDVGANAWVSWERELLGEMTTQDGEKIEWRAGWRLKIRITITEFDNYTITDFFRLAYCWTGDLRRIIIYPRPNYLPGYEVIPSITFEFTYPEDVWKGQIAEFTFTSKRLFDNLPPHTGGEGDAEEEGDE